MAENVIVVLNYNDAETTIKYLKMIAKVKSIEHIVVVDNCSTDDSYEILKKYSSERIDIIQSERNGGYAYGNNFGCKYAINKFDPKVLFISNPDTTFKNDVILRLQSVLTDETNKIGIAAPIVNQGYNVWNLNGFYGLIESIFLLWFNFDKKRIKKKIVNSKEKVIEVGVVEGSFFGIKRQVYELVGGFDERTFLYYEENILAHKLKEKKYIEVVLPSCQYNHFHSVSIKKSFGNKTRAYKNFYPSMLLYLEDYLQGNTFQRIIFNLAYTLGYFERVFYDLVMLIKEKFF